MIRPNLSEQESAFMGHMTRWGSDGYPVRKIGNGWQWVEFYGIKGAPVVYKTKKAAFEAVENYIEFLCDKIAGRIA